MEIVNFVVICLIVLCLLLSLLMIKIIYLYIHKKPILSQTVIDLCYSDCVILLYCFNVSFACGVNLCLASTTTTIGFVPSLVISVAAYFFLCNSLWSLSISGVLRLITIVKNSEQAGIQVLGPDNVAIWKIRCISIGLTSSLLLTGILHFQSLPSFFYTLNYVKTIEGTELYQQDPFIKVYLIPMFVVIIANGLPKLYGMILARKYFSEHNQMFAISLENTLAFPFLIGLLVTSQFTTRIHRLLYYDPLLLMFGCNVIPLLIIMKNNCMTKQLEEESSKLLQCLSTFASKLLQCLFSFDSTKNRLNSIAPLKSNGIYEVYC
jgi:hypothetical protein